MMNEAQVVLAGYVAREPRFRTTHNGYSYASLRVGYTPRRMDRDSGEWSDGGTSFVTVICWRGLAENVATCVRKGDPVLIKGKLQVRPFTDKDGASRLAVEVEASSMGHDLTRGVAMFQRAHRASGETALERAAGVAAPGEGETQPAPGGVSAVDGASDGISDGAGVIGGVDDGRSAGMFAEDAVNALATGVADDPEDDEQAPDAAEPGPGAEAVAAAAPF